MCFTDSEGLQGEPAQTLSSMLGNNLHILQQSVLSQWWDEWLQSQPTWLWPQWSHWSEKTQHFSSEHPHVLWLNVFFFFPEDGKINQTGKNNNSTCFHLTWQNQGDAGTPKINMGHYKTRTKFSNSSPENENPVSLSCCFKSDFIYFPWKLIWTDMCASSGDRSNCDCKSRAHEWPHKIIFMNKKLAIMNDITLVVLLELVLI